MLLCDQCGKEPYQAFDEEFGPTEAGMVCHDSYLDDNSCDGSYEEFPDEDFPPCDICGEPCGNPQGRHYECACAVHMRGHPNYDMDMP